MRLVRSLIFGSCFVACACEPAQSPEAGHDAAATLEAPAATRDAGAGAREEQPFAGSTAEATAFISNAVDKKQTEIGTCLREFRTRKKMGHDRVSISFGIDQEGKLLGVTAKGKEDVELQSCIQSALRGAAFPRSHSGVITVTKTYEELVL